MKQKCAEDKAVRTKPEAFLNAIYSIKGQGRPQPAHTEGGHIALTCLYLNPQRRALRFCLLWCPEDST